jgi:hypothetical protein
VSKSGAGFNVEGLSGHQSSATRSAASCSSIFPSSSIFMRAEYRFTWSGLLTAGGGGAVWRRGGAAGGLSEMSIGLIGDEPGGGVLVRARPAAYSKSRESTSALRPSTCQWVRRAPLAGSRSFRVYRVLVRSSCSRHFVMRSAVWTQWNWSIRTYPVDLC